MVDTTVKPASAPSFEIGYVNGDGFDWAQWDRTEQVPELRWPLSIKVYSRMAREDGRVSSVLSAIGLPIRRTPWRIDQNGASDQVTEFIARELGLPIVGADQGLPQERTKGRFSWAEHLQTVLLMLQYGHSYFEQVYRVGDDGFAHLRKLAPRPQKTISAMHVARDGGLIAIEQYTPAADIMDRNYGVSGGLQIPVERLVAYLLDPEPGHWIGNSLLRPAYKHWLLKDELMRIQAATARRNGMGVPMYQGAPGATPDDLKKGREMASAYRGGEKSGLAIPALADFKLLGVQGNLPDMQQAIEYHDKQIALSGLAHFLNLDRGGSYALASVQADTFVQSVQSFGETIRNTAQAHVVEDLVDINFGEDEPTPRIVFDEIGSRQDAIAASLKLLVDAGLLTPDDQLKAVIREAYGLPSPDPTTEQVPAPPVAPAIAPPAPQENP